jgi:hypothetical protein
MAPPLHTSPHPQGVLERNDKTKRIRFVDISDIDYDPMANMGVVRRKGRSGAGGLRAWGFFGAARAAAGGFVRGRPLSWLRPALLSQPHCHRTPTPVPHPRSPHPTHPPPLPQEFEDAMDTIHAIRPDGRVLQGTDALRALFDEVGLGWVVTLMESPILAKIVDVIYEFLSKNRIKISGAMDALVAAKRVSMAKVRGPPWEGGGAGAERGGAGGMGPGGRGHGSAAQRVGWH